jgi:hypothetical protein
MSKTIYNYHPVSKEFVSEGLADASPLEEGAYLIPAHATEVALPTLKANQVALFEDGTWQVKADWRNTPLFSIKDGSPVFINEIGITPAKVNATHLPPPSPEHSWELNKGKKGGQWVLDAAKVAARLQILKTQALQEMGAILKAERLKAAGTNDEAEIAGWVRKAQMAQAVLENKASKGESTALQAELLTRDVKGETLNGLCEKIVAKANDLALALAKIDGVKCKTTEAIANADSEKTLNKLMTALKALV